MPRIPCPSWFDTARDAAPNTITPLTRQATGARGAVSARSKAVRS